MNHVRLFAVPALLVLAAAKPADPTAAIREKVALFATSIEKGDLATLDGLYATDPPAEVIENGIAEDWIHYRDGHLAPELKELMDLRFRCESVVAEVSGDLGWATCEVSLQARLGEKAIDSVGRETLVFRRVAGDWKIVHSHSSTRARKK